MENYVEEKRLRKKTSFESPTCPICGITIRENELETHYKNELDKLQKMKKNVNKVNSPQISPSTSNHQAGESSTNCNKTDNENCWGTYQKIKENRVRRTTKLKNRKRKVEDRACPICFKIIINEDLETHADLCLRKQNSLNSDESDGESDEIDVGETYNWCGQRIRSTTLIEGSLSSAGIGTPIIKSNEDELVNIEEDDFSYGQNQYTEKNIILLNKEDERLRDLVIAGEPSTSYSEQREENNQNVANSISTSSSPSSLVDNKLSDDIDMKSVNCLESLNCDTSNPQLIIESLKAKIREYENAIRNRPKCLICLSPDFEIPVCSIKCWHVYCEKCWLKSLGAKKLCPQCNMITAATDLRRIYL